MIETNASVHQADRQAQLRARLSQAAITLARQQAEKAVKRQVQAEGRRKLSQIAHREIVALARDYLAEHPELIPEARPIIEQWRVEGFFGKRAALSVQNLQLMHSDPSLDPQALSLCETHERNGASK